MKRLLTFFLGFTLFFSFIQLSLAEFTVIPSPPFFRQFNFELEPGVSTESSIIVKNLGIRPITISVYSADGTNSSQGTFALTNLTSEQLHIGSWVKFDEDKISLEGKEEKIVPFTITAPENATPGNYGGGIAVQVSSADNNQTGDETVSTGGNVTTAARIYIKLFANIPGEKNHSYEWKEYIFNGKSNEQKPYFQFSFKNAGNTMVLAKPTIKLIGFPPLKDNVLELPEATIQPGTELENIEIRWKDQPFAGVYMAEASVDFSEFDIINNQKINTETVKQSITINLTPWYITAIIAIVLLALIVIVITYFVQNNKLIKSCIKYKVKQGDTIASIAKRNNIDWKKLARINKLKSPYTLKAGQSLLVPPNKK